jgi:eukaryotic-like serine/threonine-protein kinase
MTTSALSHRNCAQCGAVLSATDLGGLCPRCVGRHLLSSKSGTDFSAEGTPGEDPLFGDNDSAKCSEERATGQVIGHYRLVEKIGEGGFAVVFRAEQLKPVRREVALKIIKPGMDSQQVVARFEAERQALALMDHPQIARVLDGGTAPNGRAYFVMELVRGIPITDYCDQHTVSTEERLRLFVKVCRAVQHAHQKGVIHRDLKPSNILVCAGADSDARSGHPPVKANRSRETDRTHALGAEPKVIDFGIAKAMRMELTEHTVFTQLHQFVGTPAYMSPEQLEMSAADVDTRSDIYSLGVLLYQLLTGRTPFDTQELIKGDYEDLRRTIREKEPPRPSTCLDMLRREELAALAQQHGTDASKLAHLIKGDLDWIVMKCLEKNRTRRYETANALARDIERYLHSEPVVARPPSLAYRAGKFVRRNRLAVGAVAAVFTTLLAGIVLSGIGFIRANRQRQRADTVSFGANLRSAIYLLDAVGNGGRARQALDNCPVEMRDWEWDYVRCRGDQTHRVIDRGLDDVRHAVFTPGGTKVLSCRLSGLYQLWDFQSGRELARFQMKAGTPDDRPSCLALMHGPRFTPDGKKVVLFDPTKIVVWNLTTGEPVQTFTNLSPMAVHVGNHQLLSLGWLGENQEDAVIWDHLSNRLRTRLGPWLRYNLAVSQKFFPEDAFEVMFTPNGEDLMFGHGAGTFEGDNTWIDIWNVGSGRRDRRIKTAHDFCMYAADINQDHHLLATACTDGNAKVFDLNATDAAGPKRVFHAGPALRAVAISHDGRRLAAGGSGTDILVWDIAATSTNQQPDRLLGHASSIESLCFSPDDRWILSSSLDGTVRTWESEPFGSASFYLVHQMAKAVFGTVPAWDSGPFRSAGFYLILPLANDVIFSPDGRRLVSVGRQGVVKLWDAATGLELATLGEAGAPIQEVAYSADGATLAMLERESGQVTVWETETWQRRLVLQETPRRVERIKFTGASLAGYASRNRVYLWDAKDGRLKTQYSFGQSEAVATASAFSADGRLLAVSLADSPGEVRVYGLLTGQLQQVLKGAGAKINALTFNANATRVAAGAADTTALVWDLPAGRLIHRLRGHTEPVKTVVFSPSGKRLFTGSADDSLRIWKLDTEEELMSLPNPEGGDIDRIRFSPDGRTLVAMNSFWPPYFFQSSLPTEEVRKARRITLLATIKVWELTKQLQSPEQVLEALRQDGHLAPEVKKVALDIIRSRRAAAARQARPATPPPAPRPARNNR